MTLFPLYTPFKIPNLWIYLVSVIPQEGRRPRLIFYLMCSVLNKATVCKSPSEAMRFGGNLYWVIRRVIIEDPSIGLVYLSKLNLSDLYIHLWS